MRLFSIRFDDAEWQGLETLRASLSADRARPMAMGELVRSMVRGCLRDHKRMRRQVAATPMRAPEGPRARWDVLMAESSRAGQVNADDVQDAHGRFNRFCDAHNILPRQFITEIVALQPSLQPDDLWRWYYEGALPEAHDVAKAIFDAVSRWMKSNRPIGRVR